MSSKTVLVRWSKLSRDSFTWERDHRATKAALNFSLKPTFCAVPNDEIERRLMALAPKAVGLTVGPWEETCSVPNNLVTYQFANDEDAVAFVLGWTE